MLNAMRSALGLAVIVLLGITTADRSGVGAQVRPVYDSGAAGLAHLLGRLQTTARALHTGAHPDDEDSAFIARTARGDHARVAYLSLTRGEGGQNILGPELFDALGVIRTEELLQARRLDGGEQFFTRAFDFGFSKTLVETASKWNEQEILADMVRVIRLFRPLVVYSRFSGTPSDGHGQHQFAGYLTPLAFRAAADPAAFPEQLAEGLRPWQARKLYLSSGFRPDPADTPTLQLQTGILDPVIGRTYTEISAEGRSQHKSQEMGAIEPLGPFASGLRLVASTATAGATEDSVFDGLDVTVTGIARLAGLPDGALGPELRAVSTAARQALEDYRPLEPQRTVPALAAGLRATRAARQSLGAVAGPADARAAADFLLAVKESDFTEALALAAGVVVDPLADAETVVPGGTLGVSVRTFLARPEAIVRTATLAVPAGWQADAEDVPAAAPAAGGFFRREAPSATSRYQVRVPLGAPLTQPYFLAQPRPGDRYEWPRTAPRTLPFDAPLLTARVTLEVGGVAITIARPVSYRFADRIRGELRREVAVVPPVALGLDSRLLIVPTDGGVRTERLVVRATSLTPDAVAGTIRLKAPDGWQVTPASAPVNLTSLGEVDTATFLVTIPPQTSAGTWALAAEATLGGNVYAQDVETVAYPHIQSRRLYSPASATVQVFDLRVAPVRVGYVMGSGDDVPDALRRMGVDVTLLDNATLATGDLTPFDTIVVGVRASEARPDFAANSGRLRSYMERGGTLVVQYQQTDYPSRNLPPYPVRSQGNVRVTDETASVRILAPDHPVFTFPNRIGPGDFDGWVQERNLYAFGTFDAQYTPLLESADPGEGPQRGGEVYARVGQGHYVYTAYAWFRQLRAGVPGAYRQFANLVSLSKAP
jgi:LmbE family N-acetylglucosaminyl deacetylase